MARAALLVTEGTEGWRLVWGGGLFTEWGNVEGRAEQA